MPKVTALLTQWGISIGLEVAYKPGLVLIGYLAGNALAILCSPVSEYAGESTPADGEIGYQAATLVAELSPSERQEIGRLLDEAFRGALCEAFYDIGGQPCFSGFPPRRWFDVPMEAVFPLAGGRNLWHVRDPRTAEICRLLHSWADVQKKASPDVTENTQKIAEVWPSMQCLGDIGRSFFYTVVDPQISNMEEPLFDLPLFETHVQRWAFERTWARLGEKLSEAEYHGVWQTFCDLLLSGADELVGTWRRRDLAGRFIEVERDTLSLDLAQLIAKSGAIRKTSDERIEEVFGRVAMEG